MTTYDIAYLRGHGNGDKGAVGNNRTEFDICAKRVNKVVEYLRQGGLKVYTNCGDENNFEKNLLANVTLTKKFAITDHMNSSSDVNAKGVEMWVPCREKDCTLEKSITSSLAKYLTNRGVRKRIYDNGSWEYAVNGYATNSTDYYKEIRQSWSMGISHDILEMGFISNFYDVKAIEEYQNEIALTIANCILQYFGKNPIVEKKVVYRVVANSYYDKKLAEEDVEKLKKLGYQYTYIKED